MASTVKLTLHDFLEEWISSAQQGFLNGRPMMRNIYEMDYLSKLYTMQEHRPALIFFDFKAAFPSVDHQFMWHILQKIGLGDPWIRMIKLFYHDNLHAKVGIWQGCPLSPLIFAVVADILLRYLQKIILQDKGKVRAFADDTAVALKDLRDLERDWEAAKAETLRIAAGSGGMQLVLAATYLGAMLGPKGFVAGWDAPMQKFASRLSKWKNIHMGTSRDIQIYKIFCFSILQQIFTGPGNWLTGKDTEALYTQMRAPYNFPQSNRKAMATALRLLNAEQFLSSVNRQEEVEAAFNARADAHYMVHPWEQWIREGIVATPYIPSKQAAQRSPPSSGTRRPRRTRRDASLRQAPDILPRIRDKLTRWKLLGFPRILAERALNILRVAFALVPPRVAQAYFSLLWNGWTTQRRFQRSRRCVMCNEPQITDAIEHYICCKHTQRLMKEYATAGECLRAMFVLDNPKRTEAVTRLLLIHVINTLQNMSRATATPIRDEWLLDRARTALVHATAGHTGCTRIRHVLLHLLGAQASHPARGTKESLPVVRRRRL
eukprot:gene289-782_t